MLQEILIENLLIIDSIRVSLHAGLNVISGETGVGKSLLLSAIGLLFGEKLAPGYETDGEMRVEGLFSLDDAIRSRLSPAIRELVDDELVIRVVRKPGGAQRCYANGSMVSRKELRESSSGLVDVHGQHDMQRLLSQREQVAVLDIFAGSEDEREEYVRVLRNHREAREKLQHRDALEHGVRDRLELLRFQVEELKEAELKSGEHEDLTARWRMVSRAGETMVVLDEGHGLLETGDDSVMSRITRIGGSMERLGGDDPEVAELAERVFAAGEVVSDVARDIHSMAAIRSQPMDDIGGIEARLNLLNDLMRKYDCEEKGLIRRLEKGHEEILELEEEMAGYEDLEQRTGELEIELLEKGGELAEKREKAGVRLVPLVEAELASLNMPDARIRVDSGIAGDETQPVPTPLGLGSPRFLIRTNPGADFVELEAAASGGELSRVMLALKSVLAGAHRIPLLVLDEIEAGVGPRLGGTLGRKLRGISNSHQVICITHLPQIAAFADCHLRLEKIVDGESTRVQVETVEGDGRLNELADMLGGGDGSLARRQAASLLDKANEFVAGESA